MKKVIAFSLTILIFNSLKAQQKISNDSSKIHNSQRHAPHIPGQMPNGFRTVTVIPKEIMQGTYAKAFTILSVVGANTKTDSSIRVMVIVHLLDSAGNGSPNRTQQMNKDFIFKSSALPHNPPTREDVIKQVAAALNVQVVYRSNINH